MPFCFILFLCLFVLGAIFWKWWLWKKPVITKKKRREEQGGFKQDIVGNITHDAIQRLPRCLSKSFPPHELIQVAGYFFRSTPPHPFELHFCPVPVGLYILRVDSRWAHKFHGVIYCSMSRYVWKIAHLVVTGPLVWMDDRSLGNMLLQNREESGSSSVWHNLHEPQCWWLRGVYHAEDPDFRCRSATNMVLNYDIVLKMQNHY